VQPELGDQFPHERLCAAADERHLRFADEDSAQNSPHPITKAPRTLSDALSYDTGRSIYGEDKA
jgi:hypothetical protein